MSLSARGELTLEYMAELFSPATAGRLADSLTALLRRAVAAPATPLAALPLMKADAAVRMLKDVCSGPLRPERAAAPVPLHEQFEAAVAAAPAAPCLVLPEGVVSTYGEVG